MPQETFFPSPILGIVVGIILLLVAYSFKLLHLRGADQVIIGALGITIISLVVNTIYVLQNPSREG